MLRKFVISLLFASLIFSQRMFFASPQIAAEADDISELAAMLPDSDVVATINAERILNVAAPSLLGGDAKKIEHLKNLMRTIENQIGVSPYEIRQMAFGLKLPASSNLASKDVIFNSDFTVIVRTANPNGELLDTWSKRIDVIWAFKEEQSASRKLMDDFKQYRDFKFEKAAPEKTTAATQKFTESLEKTRTISKALDELPKLTTNAKAVADLRTKNKTVAASVNNYLNILKADTDTKTFRETSTRLLNRWNAVTVDDGQRTAKLNGILAESKNIHPAYRQKFENARKLEALSGLIEPAPEDEPMTAAGNLNDEVNSELDKTLTALADLPAAKVKRTAALNVIVENLDNLNGKLGGKLESLNPVPDEAEVIEPTVSDKTKAGSFYETLKKAERETKVNGRRMIVINPEKLDEPLPPVERSAEAAEKKEAIPELAIGFLDERTMVVGFERTITPMLKREAGYKNQKAIEMLGTSQNSLMAFAVNSFAVKTLIAETAKPNAQNIGADVLGSTVFDNFARNINIYGSVNYDAGSITNDITMSLGFFKEKAEQDSLPEIVPATTTDNPKVDNTFEIAGYQVGKDIFYDLFNSFRAVQASLTFKFEKKKIAALIRATPQIIDRIKTARSATSKEPAKVSKTKSDKLRSFQDLMTAPQLYIDLAGLVKGKS